MPAKQPISRTSQRSFFDRFAGQITRLAGSPWAFSVATGLVFVWAATGPIFQYSAAWQMVINTGTTIVTFMMVFLIQQSQNKDSLAVHIKLNELLAAQELASNRVVAVEDLHESDLATLQTFYGQIAELAQKEGGIKRTHSLDDAATSHRRKSKLVPKTRSKQSA